MRFIALSISKVEELEAEYAALKFEKACKQLKASLEESIELIDALKLNDPIERKRFGKGDRRKNKKNFNQQFRR